MPSTFTEGSHPQEFILTEANGSRSRANAKIKANTAAIAVGQVLRRIAGTTDDAENYVPITVGNTATHIAMYAAPNDAANVQYIAVLARDAEVNGKLLVWPAGMSAADIAQGIANLASASGIIVRSEG